MRSFPLLLLVFSVFSLNAQLYTADRYQLASPGAARTAAAYAPLVAIPSPYPALNSEMTTHTAFRLQKHVLHRLYTAAPKTFRLQFPEAFNGIQELELERQDWLAQHLRVKAATASGQVPYPIRESFHYWGKVAGEANSLVSVSVFATHLVVQFTTPEGDFTVGPAEDNPHNDVYIGFNDRDVHHPPKHVCNAEAGEVFPTTPLPREQRATVDCKRVRMYYVADFQLYQDNGSSVQATADYIAALHSYTALLYQPWDVPLEISEILVFTALDPFAGLATAGDIYSDPGFDFGDFLAGGFNGDLAAFLTTRSIGGGIATSFVSALNDKAVYCAASPSTRRSVSGINAFPSNSNLFPLPTYSWAVEVNAHEIGHNCGNPHTQVCNTWGSTPERYDDCFSDEDGPANCTSLFTLAAGSNLGSVMSYCHIGAGKVDFPANPVGISFTVGFADLPGQNLTDNYTGARGSCLECPCFDAYEPSYSLATASTGLDTLSPIAATQIVQGTIHNIFDEDYYQLVATEDGTLDITLSGLAEDFDLEFLDNTGTALATSTTTGTGNETALGQAITNGSVYYIRVFPKGDTTSSCTAYTLTLNWAPVSACTSPGFDTTFAVCTTNPALDLFANLGGTPAAGGTWAELDATTAVTGNLLDATALPGVGTYRFAYSLPAGGGCPARSATVTVGAGTCVPTCQPTYTVPDCGSSFRFIAGVYLCGGITDYSNTDLTPTCYSDFTGTPIAGVLDDCQNSSVTLRMLHDLACYTNTFEEAYVDWNQDGDFDDANETVGMTDVTDFSTCTPNGTNCGGGQTGSQGTVTVPPGTGPGIYLLRCVMGHNETVSGPCGTYERGETEDYLLVVQPGDTAATYAVTPATQTVCENGVASLHLTNTAQGVSYAVYEGLTKVSDDYLGAGNAPLTLAVAGLSVGSHTLTIRAAGGACDGSDLDMANTVTVTVSNGATGPATEPFVGTMLELNVASDQRQAVFVPNDTLLNLSSGPFTASAWAQPTTLSDAVILSKEITPSLVDYRLELLATGQLRATTHGNSIVLTSTTTVAATEWVHVALVKDGASATLYVNGVAEASAALTGSPVSDYRSPLCIGCQSVGGEDPFPGGNNPNGAYFRGYIDEVVLHNQALSAVEIREQMHLIRSGCNSGIVAYWQFEDDADSTYSAYNGLLGTGTNSPALAPSTLNVATGNSFTLSGIANGANPTGATQLSNINFTGVAGSLDVVVTEFNQDVNPNTSQLYPAPVPVNVDSGVHWIVNAFGSGSFTNAEFFFNEADPVADADLTLNGGQANIRLVSRGSRSYAPFTTNLPGTAVFRTTGTQADILVGGIAGFSQFVLGSTTLTTFSTVLPVEQLRFAAEAYATGAQLTWTTASESNNYGFFVEMKAPTGGSAYTDHGFVPGSGTTGLPQQYSYIVPDLAPGTYLFRLRQVDYDGREAFSNVEEVVIGGDDRAPLQVFPNPNRGAFTIAGDFGTAPAQAALYDAVGHLVWEGELAQDRTELRLELPAGVYTLLVRGSQAPESFKLVIQR